MSYHTNYNFDSLNITDLLLHKNLYEILFYNKEINKLLTNEQVKPELNLTSTTIDDYIKFINAHLPDTPHLFSNLKSHILLEAITQNLHINISKELYSKIKEALPNPTFLELIFINNIPKYEVKIYFDGIQAEKDFQNLSHKTYKYYFGPISKKN